MALRKIGYKKIYMDKVKKLKNSWHAKILRKAQPTSTVLEEIENSNKPV